MCVAPETYEVYSELCRCLVELALATDDSQCQNDYYLGHTDGC